MGWREKAKELKFIEGLSWTETSRQIREQYFESEDPNSVHEKVRGYLRGTPEYKDLKKEDFKQSSIEYKKDGSVISEKFITVRDADDITPEFILEAHGLNPALWEVVGYKNNMWNTQVKGGSKQISYQSKLTAKPKVAGLDLGEIDKHFAKLDRQHFTPVAIKQSKGNMLAEVNISDLHLGKLCWHGNTPENYDYKIARQLYYRLLAEIAEELKSKPIDYIVFVWADDFFNSDNESQTTTGGTPQDTDIRHQKLYNVGVEMLVRGIETLSQIAKVETFYTPSNHDQDTGHYALKYLEAWFRKDPNVTVEQSVYPRKYKLYGNTLIGFCHGAKENSNSNKEKASRLASLMPLEVPELWGRSLFREMHTKHLHSEQMICEINGVIVRRISSPTALDTWHTENAYVGAVRKAQTFLYDKDRGLMQVINTPV
ncbi:MAG: hypothetical protein M0P69_12315 [Bacteroidales bacterium]|nr:hypothetical protein [Bacteroidales bacterium]